ncbi:hypothetical protein [Microbacterium sp. PA5]|uniref:hypothetical protein n=1 Tax=Microbacterium sp. PA5 TaxID=3416654 RepID=UPI003CE69416
MKTPSSFATVAAAAAVLLLTSCTAATSQTPEETKPSAQATDAAPPVETSEAAAPVEALPFNAGGLLGGTATPTFEAGEPGEVSVVQVGTIDDTGFGGTLPFAFRNNTAEAIAHVDWSATARADGSIVATGSSQGTAPSIVQPGEVGLAYIYFEEASAIEEGTEFEFEASTSPADPTPYNTAPMTVTEATLVNDSIVGGADNKTGESTTGPYSVSVYCFDGDTLVGHTTGFTEQDTIAVDATGTFTVSLYDMKCSTFAVGVSGYFD